MNNKGNYGVRRLKNTVVTVENGSSFYKKCHCNLLEDEQIQSNILNKFIVKDLQ